MKILFLGDVVGLSGCKKIKKKKKILTIGLAYSFQKVKKIPINNYDIKLDYIVTEKKD